MNMPLKLDIGLFGEQKADDDFAKMFYYDSKVLEEKRY